MASSRGTSNGPDWKDVNQALLNYESLWNCKITLSIHVDGWPGLNPFLMLEGKAEPRYSNQELKLSVSVSATMKGLNATSLSAAFLHILHKLDCEVEVHTAGLSR